MYMYVSSWASERPGNGRRRKQRVPWEERKGDIPNLFISWSASHLSVQEYA